MKNFKIIIVVFLVIAACKANTYLPTPNEMNYYTKGMWIECQIPDKRSIFGELLALNENQLFILPLSSSVLTVERHNIKSAVLHISLTTNNPEELRAGPLIPLLTVFHGWFMIITMPINLMVVAPTVGTHRSGAYVVGYPKAITWEQMAKFSRFPQGIPQGLDIYSLKENTAKK